jgi:hypothetical protein
MMVTGRVVDLYARAGVEWMLLDNKKEIRLDHLVRFNGKSFEG